MTNEADTSRKDADTQQMREAVSKPILSPMHGGPHVFILGAGTSRAVCPDGDKNGKKIPLMNDLIEIVGLQQLLTKSGIQISNKDFEAVYSELSLGGNHADLLNEIEKKVFDYFASLELPEEPTLYDHLVLSLRKKDLIVTFNWDPFLPQALHRVYKRFGNDALPLALYLHGNVAIGYCNRHEPKTIGVRGYCCGKCGEMLETSHLLYPVTQKNYRNDPSISKSWDEVQRHLKHAFLLTIFGYRAPETDVEAIDLLKAGWKNGGSRSLEQIELIDIREKDDLYRSWEPFICRNHYSVWDNFYNSYCTRQPRRSCEDRWETYLQNNPQHERPVPRDASWEELENFFSPLIEQERTYRRNAD